MITLALALFLAPSDAVSLWVPSAPGLGDVVTIDASDGSALPVSGLDQIELLPIEFTGRSQLDALDPARPRLLEPAPGSSRVALAEGRGSLYRYRRDVAGESAFGLLWIDPDGAARSVFELDATAASQDSWFGELAVESGGVLLASTLAAGGSLFEVDLATSVVEERASSLAWTPGGLALTPGWGAAMSAEGPYRFARTPGATASKLPFEGASPTWPTWFGEDFVVSGSGNAIAFLAGSDAQHASVYVAGATGPARNVSGAPAWLSPAGHLPEHPHGPYLALSRDGQLAAWRTESATSREAFLGRTGIGLAPPEHFTSDALFADTLDEIGLFGFVSSGALFAAVGELGNEGELEKADLFRAQLPELPTTGGVGLTNATLTSQETEPPFFAAPGLTPENVHHVPGAEARLVYDDDGETLLLAQTGDVPPTQILDAVDALDLVELAGSHLFFTLRREYEDEDRRELWSLSTAPGATPNLIASLPKEVQVDCVHAGPDGELAAIVSLGVSEWLVRLDLATGSAEVLTPFPLDYAPNLAFAPDGTLALSAGFQSPDEVTALWSKDGGLVLAPLPPGPKQLLPN